MYCTRRVHITREQDHSIDRNTALYRNLKQFLVSFLLLTLANLLHAEQQAVILRVTEIDSRDQFYNTYNQIYTQAEYETDSLKYYDAIYWEQRGEIRFYEFPNGFNAYYCTRTNLHGHTEQECIDYREQYALQVSIINANIHPEQMSASAADAYEIFTVFIAQKHPNAWHGLSFSGHGSPGGKLFHGLIYPAHAQKLLKDWSMALGKKLAFIDMGGPCNKGAYGDLNMLCPYTDYYIASDLPNSGFLPNKEYTHQDYSNDGGIADIEVQYHRIFRENRNLLAAMKQRIDVRQLSYDRASDHITDIKNNTVHSPYHLLDLPYEQANYLYSCKNFKKLYDRVNDDYITALKTDLRNYFTTKYSDPERTEVHSLFDNTIVYKADTRNIAEWLDNSDTHGMLAAARPLANELENNSALSYPLINYPKTNITDPSITPVIIYLLGF